MLSGDWPPANNTVSTTAITVQRNNNKLEPNTRRRRRRRFPSEWALSVFLYNTRKQEEGRKFYLFRFSFRLIESELHKLLPDHYFLFEKLFLLLCLVSISGD
jgi:hypothetical protein